MTQPLNKLYVRIVISVLIGFLFVGAFVNIQYPCPPLDAEGCVSFDSAVMHPNDLISNKQGSLDRFVINFAIVSLISFGLLSTYNQLQKRNPKKPKSF